MSSDDFGRDLASVQALLRKHEGLERDLAALGDKARMNTSFSRSHHSFCLSCIDPMNKSLFFERIPTAVMRVKRVNVT